MRSAPFCRPALAAFLTTRTVRAKEAGPSGPLSPHPAPGVGVPSPLCRIKKTSSVRGALALLPPSAVRVPEGGLKLPKPGRTWRGEGSPHCLPAWPDGVHSPRRRGPAAAQT